MQPVPARPGRLLLLLTLAMAISHLDRHVLAIVLDQIGAEFSLSDLQLGLLSGLSFAVVYALFGFVAARLSVAGMRKRLIVGAVTMWSSATAAIGLATGFATLLLGRIAVGIGEAAVVPCSHSMISDAYPPARRASALAVFQTGANIGLFLAFVGGGFVALHWGWRVTFFVAAAPGLLLAVCLMIALREPMPDQADDPLIDVDTSLGDVARAIWHTPGARHAFVGSVLASLVSFGGISWVPTYLIRTHDLSLQQVGLYLAVLVGVFGSLGTLLGGILSDRMEQRRHGGRMMVVVVAMVVAKLGAIAFYALGPVPLALVVFALPVTLNGIYVAPALSHIYGHLRRNMLPRATALVMFGANFVGLSLGPLFVGLVSDLTRDSAGALSLGIGLGLLQAFGFWAAWHFHRAGRLQAPLEAQGRED